MARLRRVPRLMLSALGTARDDPARLREAAASSGRKAAVARLG